MLKFYIIILFLYSNVLFSQNSSIYWQHSRSENVSEKKFSPLFFTLNTTNFVPKLFSAESEKNVLLKKSKTELSFPLLNGTFCNFKIVRYEMMESDLSSKFSNFGTFYGVSKDLKKIRISWTELGLHAVIISNKNVIIIERKDTNSISEYVVYNEKDETSYSDVMHCKTMSFDSENILSKALGPVGDCKFRTYRLAVTTTWEYSNDRGAFGIANQALVLSEVINTVNFMNMIFENDLSIRLILVNNVTSLFYYNQTTDPFTSSGPTIIKQNHTNTNLVIGASNYDIGHLFTRGNWDGVAALKSACKSSKKGRARSSRKPNGSMQRHARTIMHEIGHQFGATHTQNNNCNKSNGSSYEPGSGSTLMSYAGVCAPNVIKKSELYYHIKSLKQIHTYINTIYCASLIPNPNSSPIINAGKDYIIPVSTPFKLTPSSFSDIDNDSLTFCWEQYDNESAQMPPIPTNTKGPSFRSFIPSISPSRFFPEMNKIINNNLTSNWECLPSVSRIMHFRVTVRDNSSNLAGCIAEDIMEVTFTNQAGPFIVTRPSSVNITWTAGTNELVLWDVALTDQPPVNCDSVDLLLSTDGGFTYNIVLAKNVANTGSKMILVPNVTTDSARIMIVASNNIFFDISDTNFKIIKNTVSTNAIIDITNLEVYPNPAKNKVTFKLNAIFSSVEIYNTLGKKIDVIYNVNTNKVDLFVEKYSPGLYIFKITTDIGEVHGKFLKN